MGITIKEIDKKLHSLSDDKLEVVYEFVTRLTESEDDPLETALLSERSLGDEWNTPEEDEAWRHLDALPSC